MFSGTYCVKKKKKGGGGAGGESHTINYYGKSGDSRTPTPNKGSIREIATGEITLPITPDDHLEGPYLLKTRELPGAPPPRPRRAPGPHPYEARGALRARISRPPLFFVQILDPPLYTSPLARPSRLPPEASILGELGSSRPLPPMKILGGGKPIFLPPPPPPNSFVNLKN